MININCIHNTIFMSLWLEWFLLVLRSYFVKYIWCIENGIKLTYPVGVFPNIPSAKSSVSSLT